MCIFCLFTTQLRLVILGKITAARWESWYRKLEFCFTSFWFHYYQLWWSSWHAMLALFFWYVFLVWIFSWCDLFQVTAADASCALYIIFFQFITFEPVSSILPIAPGLLHFWHHFMPLCFALALICFWLNLIVQFTSELSLSCVELCKVSTEDGDHVIS